MLRISKNPAVLASLQTAFALAGVVNTASPVRADAAADTLYLARELEAVSAVSYDVLHDPTKGRILCPFNWSVPEGAETWSYDMYDGFAKAEWITNGASAVGQAEAFKTRTSKNVREFGSHYKYSIQDLAAAQMAGGRPLDRENAKMCRISHEQFIDDLIAVGDSTRGIPGLTNASDIPTVAPAVGTWDSATATLDLMKDLDKLVLTPELSSKQNFVADTLVLPLSVKTLMRQPFSTNDARTVEKVWLGNQDANGVKSIEYWARLNTASAIGGPRALAYKKSNAVFEFVGSFDFQELPPERAGYWFQVLTRARVVGLVLRYVLAMAKMDLDASP